MGVLHLLLRPVVLHLLVLVALQLVALFSMKENGSTNLSISLFLFADTIYMIESPQDSSSGIASDDLNAGSSSMPGSTFSTSFLDSELSDDHVTSAGLHHVTSGATSGGTLLPPGGGHSGVHAHAHAHTHAHSHHHNHHHLHHLQPQSTSAASLSSQQGGSRLSSDPESFTQDESDTGVRGQGYSRSRGVYHGYRGVHDNKPRSRVPLSPKVTVKDAEPVSNVSARTSHLATNGAQRQYQGYAQQQQQQQQQHHALYPAYPHPNQKQRRDVRNSYVNVQLNGYHQPDFGYSPEPAYPQNGYAQPELYEEGYPAYPYKGYSLEETERLIQQAKKKNKLSYFDLLPDDVIIRILGSLPGEEVCRCARVSRRWYSLAWDPALWTGIRLNDPDLDVDRALKQLTKRLSYDTPTVCVMVERINLNGYVTLPLERWSYVPKPNHVRVLPPMTTT